jgi:hypothetical protein
MQQPPVRDAQEQRQPPVPEPRAPRPQRHGRGRARREPAAAGVGLDDAERQDGRAVRLGGGKGLAGLDPRLGLQLGGGFGGQGAGEFGGQGARGSC